MRQITGRDGLRKCLVTPTRVVEKLKGLPPPHYKDNGPGVRSSRTVVPF
jgi:hypothetical protein